MTWPLPRRRKAVTFQALPVNRIAGPLAYTAPVKKSVAYVQLSMSRIARPMSVTEGE